VLALNSIALLDYEALVARADRDLDWELLLDRLAGMTTSEPGARRLRSRALEGDWASAHASMVRTSECLGLTDEGLALPSGDLPDLLDLIGRLERGATATGPELRDLGRMLELARTLRAFVKAQQKDRPALAAWLEIAQGIDRLNDRLQRSIDNDGALKDDASPALGRARAKVKQARQELVSQLKRLMHVHADLLRDQYFSERDGRYVIPVRADAHRGIDGVVLDTSASGNTLFVEPRELTSHSNHLRLALSDVTQEEQRLLRELSACAKELAPELHQAENSCTEADVLSALARWAKRFDAVAILPQNEPILELRAVRHPLLVGHVDVVPNDLELRAGRTLLLSGPNAGGKTVTLKCLGLAARMVRAGIPICVDPRSRIGFFSAIYTEIGDSQSIAANLSTFSAHVLVLASILAKINDSALVLLDEVAGGTDPEQGAALATAYLEALLERGVAVAATTHYEALKELGNTDPRFQNAAVGFDVATMMPTFRVINGVAGPSTALAVATRYGITAAIIERAHALIPTASRDRERLLEELASERTQAERLRREVERDATEQRRLCLELEQERAEVRTTFQRQLEQEYRDLLGRIRGARTELEAVKLRLRDLPHDRQAIAQLERAVDGAAHSVSLGSAVAEAVRTNKSPTATGLSPAASALTVGQRVHVARLSTDVEVLEPPRKGSVRVRAGAVTLTLAISELSAASTKAAGPKPSANKSRKRGLDREPLQMVQVRTTPMRMSHNTLDLRGERVEAALDRVDGFVDELLQRGEPAGYILHGHGTGALKQAVREHVRSLRQVLESGPAGPEDGGDAFTLLWMGE
jgi:DNA mismatch repair protein MutS2